jgi:hypothetical protein
MKKILLLVALMATFIGVSAQNPYAYGLKVTNLTSEGGTFHYKLNTPAQAVELQFLNGDEVVATIPMPETMLGTTDHEYIVNFADLNLPAGELKWAVKVKGEVVESPVEITSKVLKFFSPAGVAVDVDPASPDFGSMYVTESTAKESSTYYTASVNGSTGIGLYKFDPQFNGIKNEAGTYGFNCGMQSTGTTLVDWRPARIQISDDGRMFILSQRVNTGYPLYEINRETLAATPFFEGTLDTSTGIVTNGDVQVAAGVGVAFDLQGSGEDLKLMLMTCTPGTTTVPANYKTNEYNIGTATSWGEAPSRNFTAFDGKAINYAGINLAYDGAGGIWMSQWRGAPTENEPSYAFANVETDELVSVDASIYSRNGGMAFNKDHTLFIRGEAYSKTAAVYSVENGALTKLYEYSLPSFTGFNQFAFDYANNVIACDNSAEVFGMIQLPNGDGFVTTPGNEAIVIEEPQPTHTYTAVGEPAGFFGTVWTPTIEANDMTLNAETGVYEWTSPQATLNAGDKVLFKVVEDHSWTINYGVDGVLDGANVEITAEKAGIYTLTVYFDPQNNNNVTGKLTLIEEIMPEYSEFYAVGFFNNWSTAENRVVFEEKEAGVYEATLNLEAGSDGEFKVIAFDEAGAMTWFGGADDNNQGFFLINNDMLDIDITLTNGANFRPEEAGNYIIQIYEKPATTGIKAISEPLVMKVSKKSDTTSIATVGSDVKGGDNAWYNLQGVRFENKPAAPGIYIHGGKKVVVK